MGPTQKVGISFVAAGALAGVLISALGLQEWRLPIYAALLSACAVGVYRVARSEEKK
jgi:hypothetical protein